MQKVIPNTRPTRDGNLHRSTGMRALQDSSSGHNACLAVRATFESRQSVNSWGRSQKSGMWHRLGTTTIGYAFALGPAERRKERSVYVPCALPNHGAFDVEAILQRRNPQARNRPQNRLNRLWIIGTHIGGQFEALLRHGSSSRENDLICALSLFLAVAPDRAGISVSKATRSDSFQGAQATIFTPPLVSQGHGDRHNL